MAKFLAYITDIETLTAYGNNGDGDAVFHIQCTGFGLPGDSGANIEIPIQCSGDMGFESYTDIEFPAPEAVGQSGSIGAVDFLIECSGTLDLRNDGIVAMPLIECSAWGRLGNDGDCIFYLLLVSGEGNANREYELCD